MDLKDSVAVAQKTGARHKLDNVLAECDPETREVLDDALHDLVITHVAVSRALKRSGYDVSPTSVRRYRTDVLGVSRDS